MNGKKTYLVALAGLLGAGYSYLTGAMDAPQAIQTALTSILAATIRHGISTSTTPPTS